MKSCDKVPDSSFRLGYSGFDGRVIFGNMGEIFRVFLGSIILLGFGAACQENGSDEEGGKMAHAAKYYHVNLLPTKRGESNFAFLLATFVPDWP